MCKTIAANSPNMQRTDFVSKIQIGLIAIVCSVLCVPIVIIIGVVIVSVIDLMSMYCYCYQQILSQYQMVGLFKRCGSKRLQHFTTAQKQLHCQLSHRWHCGNQNNNNICDLGQYLLTTMRINMPVMMMG